MRVLAKGVCRADQLTMLASLGCDQYQGELLSPPLQADAMFALLQAHRQPDPITTTKKARTR